MSNSFSGWTLTTIYNHAVQAYGSGWTGDADKVTEVKQAIMSAWTRLAAEFDVADIKPSASTPSYFLELWFLLSMLSVADPIGASGCSTQAHYVQEFGRFYAICDKIRSNANVHTYNDA